MPDPHPHQVDYESTTIALGPPQTVTKNWGRYFTDADGRKRMDSGCSLDPGNGVSARDTEISIIMEPNGDVWLIDLSSERSLGGRIIGVLQRLIGGPRVPWVAVSWHNMQEASALATVRQAREGDPIPSPVPPPVPPAASPQLPEQHVEVLGDKEILGRVCFGQRIVTIGDFGRIETEHWQFAGTQVEAVAISRTDSEETRSVATFFDDRPPEPSVFEVCTAPKWFRDLTHEPPNLDPK